MRRLPGNRIYAREAQRLSFNSSRNPYLRGAVKSSKLKAFFCRRYINR
jgi:hypothetical protein